MTGAREHDVWVFQDTLRWCGDDGALRAAIAASRKGTDWSLERSPLPEYDARRYAAPARIVVSGKRTLEAARAYAGGEGRVCVLNFASATSPGGGVAWGSSAQEESLCRISTLYPCLATGTLRDVFYAPHLRSKNPLHNDDCIYIPGIVVFRGDDHEKKALAEKDWFRCDVVTCAAPRLQRPDDLPDAELAALFVQRITRILAVCAHREVDDLVLGAFGCGAFHCPPRVVASAFRTALDPFVSAFRTVEFAVFTRPSERTNYDAFREVFG